MFHGKRVYYNVIPSDYLATLVIPYYPLCLVVNTTDSSHPGSHWVAIFRENDRSSLTFFCSYGLGVDVYGKYFTNFAADINVIQNKKK